MLKTKGRLRLHANIQEPVVQFSLQVMIYIYIKKKSVLTKRAALSPEMLKTTPIYGVFKQVFPLKERPCGSLVSLVYSLGSWKTSRNILLIKSGLLTLCQTRSTTGPVSCHFQVINLEAQGLCVGGRGGGRYLAKDMVMPGPRHITCLCSVESLL